MRVLLDVDGVLADFVPWLLNRLNLREAKPREFTEDTTLAVLLGKDGYREWVNAQKVLGAPGFWEMLPRIPGSIDGVADLRAQGYDVVFVTSPWRSCAGWDMARREWLNRHYGAPPSDVVMCERKGLVSGNVFVDDKPSMCRLWHDQHRPGISVLYDQPYNAEADWPFRSSWPKLVEVIGDYARTLSSHGAVDDGSPDGVGDGVDGVEV